MGSNGPAAIPPTMGQRARPAAVWSLIEVLARQAVMLGTTVLLARLLAPSDFGLLAMVLVFTVFGSALVEAGLGSALIQRSSVDPDDEPTAFVASAAIAAIAASLLAVSAARIAHFFGQPALAGIVPWMALSLPLAALGTVPDALLTRRLEFRKRAAAEAIASLTAAAFAIGLALSGFGIWSLVGQQLVATGLRSVLLTAFSRWIPRIRFSPSALSRLWRFGSYLLAANLLDAAYTRLQALLLGRFAGASELGQYNLAQNVQQAPTNLVSTVLNRVGLASLSPLASEPERLKEALRRTLLASMFAFAPAMLGLSLLSSFLVPWIFGEAWRPASTLLSVLALAAIPWPWHVLNLVALNSLGRSDLVLRVEISKKLVATLLVVAAGPFGALPIAWAVVAGSYLSLLFNTFYMARLLRYGLLQQIRDLLPSLFACASAGAVGLAVYGLMGEGSAYVAAATAVAVLVYLGLCLLLGQSGPRECLDIARAWRDGSPQNAPARGRGE